jgi:hypothetical protein
MRCLQTILGISIRDRWRNDDVWQVCKQQPTIEHKIRQSRLRWFRHVCRIDTARLTRRLLERRCPPGWKVSNNASRKTWFSQLQVEARQLRFTITNLAAMAQDRDQWRRICKDVLAIAATAPAEIPYNLWGRPTGARANDWLIDLPYANNF